MAKIGYGYGSECHLLRWMGRHRRIFDGKVSGALGRPGEPIEWLDFKFAPDLEWPEKGWPDAELKGLEFLYDRGDLKSRWESFWPTGRGIHNWDSVGWIGAGLDRELLLVEAKAHVAEMESNCGAGTVSIQKIKKAFEKVKQGLDANPYADWTKVYYQAANRIATLYFLEQEGIRTQLLFVYFCGDRFPGKECPSSEQEWKPAIEAQRLHLGLESEHHLSDRIHELFLPVSSNPN